MPTDTRREFIAAVAGAGVAGLAAYCFPRPRHEPGADGNLCGKSASSLLEGLIQKCDPESITIHPMDQWLSVSFDLGDRQVVMTQMVQQDLGRNSSPIREHSVLSIKTYDKSTRQRLEDLSFELKQPTVASSNKSEFERSLVLFREAIEKRVAYIVRSHPEMTGYKAIFFPNQGEKDKRHLSELIKVSGRNGNTTVDISSPPPNPTTQASSILGQKQVLIRVTKSGSTVGGLVHCSHPNDEIAWCLVRDAEQFFGFNSYDTLRPGTLRRLNCGDARIVLARCETIANMAPNHAQQAALP